MGDKKKNGLKRAKRVGSNMGGRRWERHRRPLVRTWYGRQYMRGAENCTTNESRGGGSSVSSDLGAVRKGREHL